MGGSALAPATPHRRSPAGAIPHLVVSFPSPRRRRRVTFVIPPSSFPCAELYIARNARPSFTTHNPNTPVAPLDREVL